MDGEFYAFTDRFTKHNEAQRKPFRGGTTWRCVRVFITDSPGTEWWALVDLVYGENEDIPNGSKCWKHVQSDVIATN